MFVTLNRRRVYAGRDAAGTPVALKLLDYEHVARDPKLVKQVFNRFPLVLDLLVIPSRATVSKTVPPSVVCYNL